MCVCAYGRGAQAQPDQAVDVLRSGLSMPGLDGADAARLHLALAAVEEDRCSWVRPAGRLGCGRARACEEGV